MDKQLRHLFLVTLVLFGALAIMMTWYQFVQADRLWAHPLNPRRTALGKTAQRGGFFDRNGEALTVSGKGPGSRTRDYAEESLAHVIGYVDPRYGTSGLEQAFDPDLSGTTAVFQLESAWRALYGQRGAGADITLAIDRGIQRVAAAALGDRRGAVVVMDPRNGDILAMVSRPGFDPRRVGENWFWLVRDTRLPLLNRAALGLYPPGSTFKPMVALARNETGPFSTVDCPGYVVVDGRRISEAGGIAHGVVDLNKALAVSCNVAFVTWGLQAGPGRVFSVARRFGFEDGPPLPIPAARARLPKGSISEVETAESSIGQGRLLVTPLTTALMMCGLANDGVIMAPRLVLQVRSPMGLMVRDYKPSVWLRASGRDEVGKVRNGMRSVVQWGTGWRAGIPGIEIAGKTGSAENPRGAAHAWFMAMAPAGSPSLVVVVLVENAGAGGAVAAPIAREILQEALTRR